MEENQKRLLAMLKPDQFYTAKQIADELNISEKTARERLKRVEYEIRQNGGTITSKPGKGHQLQIVDEERFTAWCEEIQQPAKAIPSTAQERVSYILHRLLYAEGFIKLDDLADELFVSRTTMTADMKQVKYILQLHNLMITQRPGYGICIEGNEFDIRNCMVDDLLQRDMLTGNQDWSFSTMRQIVDSIALAFKEYNLNLGKQMFRSLLFYVSVATKRLQDGHQVCFGPDLGETLRIKIGKNAADAAQRIGEDMFRWSGCDYIADEITGLMIQTKGRGVFSLDGADAGVQTVSEHIESLASAMLEMIYEVHALDFRRNTELFHSLVQHLVPFDVRMTHNLPSANPILAQIKQEYAMAYHIASSACIALQKEYGKPIPDTEVGYFAVLFAVAIQRTDRPPRKNVLVVCISGQATSKLFLHRYQTAFASYVDHIYTCSAFQVAAFDFAGLKIDYVFTTVPLHLKLPVPVFEVSPLLDNQEINQYRRILQGEDEKFHLQFFKEELFCGEIAAENKEDALSIMYRTVAKTLPLPPDFLESVLAREKMGQTDFGNLIAIPHPSRIMGTEKFVSVAILKKPVWWGHNDVQVILLISLEQDDPDADRFYQVVSEFMGSPAAIQALIEKPTFQTLLKVLEHQH